MSFLNNRLIRTLASLCLALMWLPALGQDAVSEEAASVAAETDWSPPDISSLPNEWWADVASSNPADTYQRVGLLIAAARTRVAGMGDDELTVARNSLSNLENLNELLLATQQAQPLEISEAAEAVTTKQNYNLDELLALRSQWRRLNRRTAQLGLDRNQSRRQVELIDQRRAALQRQYQASVPESPTHMLLGLDKVAGRLELQLVNGQLARLQTALEAARKQRQLIEGQLAFAREHLAAGEVDLSAVMTSVAQANSRSLEMQERVTAARQSLLTVISAETVNESLRVVREQQLTRSSAEAVLARIQEAVTRTSASWFHLSAKDQSLSSSTEPEAEVDQALVNQAIDEIEVWTAASQATLASTIATGDLNTVKNLELARSVARDTLALVDDITDAVDDLELVQEIRAEAQVDSKSGISKAWASLTLAVDDSASQFSGLFNYSLFSIGETPVTPGGIIKMLLIVVFAYLLSWVLRRFIWKLLDRVSGQFAESPAVYSLGRVMHYVIMVSGTLVALGSVGMDFTNFALIAGALSVGIGFGLQAIVNNFVSGLILLFEGSLRVGDYIQLDSGLSGVVREINTRATVVNTNDSVDVVVPNSELVTTKLTNWTLREPIARMCIPFGVAYGSDKELVREAALKAAAEMEFVLLKMPGREPQVRLMGFGDSALDFEMRAWVGRQGVRRPVRVRSSFLWALDTHLREAGIEVPFPQRDLHIKDGPPRTVSINPLA